MYFSNAAKAAHDTTKKQLRSPIDQGLVHTWNEGRALEERVTNFPQSTASRTQMMLAPHRAIQKPTRKIRATTRCMEEMRLPAITVADIDNRLDFYESQTKPGLSRQLCRRYLKEEMGVALPHSNTPEQLRQLMRDYLANDANRGVRGTGASATFRPLNGMAPLLLAPLRASIVAVSARVGPRHGEQRRWPRAGGTEPVRGQRVVAVRVSATPGVTWHPVRRKWIARINVGGKQTHLGAFEDEGAAVAAITAKRAEIGPPARPYSRTVTKKSEAAATQATMAATKVARVAATAAARVVALAASPSAKRRVGGAQFPVTGGPNNRTRR